MAWLNSTTRGGLLRTEPVQAPPPPGCLFARYPPNTRPQHSFEPSTPSSVIVPDPLSFLDWEYYHNTVREWLTALGIFVVVFVALVVVRRLLGRRLRIGAGALERARADSVAADLVRRTGLFFLFALALAAASYELVLPTRVETILRAFDIIVVLGQVGIWGDGLVTSALHHYVGRRSTPSGGDGDAAIAASRTTIAALTAVGRVVLWILLLLVALDSLGVRVTALVTGLGVTGIALALAVQNILGDLFAALSIVMDKPFVVGDAIGVDTLSGTVEHIGLKTTRVRSITGEQIVFSNTDLLKSRIRNYRRLRERTVTYTVTLDLASSPDAITAVPTAIRELIHAQADVRFGRSHITTPTSAGIGVETVYTVPTPTTAASWMCSRP